MLLRGKEETTSLRSLEYMLPLLRGETTHRNKRSKENTHINKRSKETTHLNKQSKENTHRNERSNVESSVGGPAFSGGA